MGKWLERSPLVLKVPGSKDSFRTEFHKNSLCSLSIKWIPGSLKILVR